MLGSCGCSLSGFYTYTYIHIPFWVLAGVVWSFAMICLCLCLCRSPSHSLRPPRDGCAPWNAARGMTTRERRRERVCACRVCSCRTTAPRGGRQALANERTCLEQSSSRARAQKPKTAPALSGLNTSDSETASGDNQKWHPPAPSRTPPTAKPLRSGACARRVGVRSTCRGAPEFGGFGVYVFTPAKLTHPHSDLLHAVGRH